MAEQAPKRRKARRNFSKELQEIETYCKVSIEVLNEDVLSDFSKGQVASFTKILAKIGGSKS